MGIEGAREGRVIGLMLIHIVGGSIALLSGAGALMFSKGGRWHARAGSTFFVSMLVLAGTGAVSRR